MLPPRHNPIARRDSAFSLIELTVAIAISAIVLTALGSAIVLASRALPSPDNPAAAGHRASRVLEQLNTDLYHALHIHEHTSTAITFTVADRTGDGSPQRIRYAWAGSPGDPLTWQLDDHEPVALIPAVEAFNLTYQTDTHTRTYAGLPDKHTGIIVADHNLPSLSSRDTFSITANRWVGQRVNLDLPFDPTTETLVDWTPTYVRYYAAKSALFVPDHWVQLVIPELNHTPSDQTLAHKTQSGHLLNLFNLFGYSWTYANFDTTQRIMPDQPVNLVIRHPGSGATAAYVQYDNSTTTGGLTRTTNGQHAWETPYNNQTLIHRIYADVHTAGPDQSLTRNHLTRINLTLQPSGDAALPFTSGIHLPNRPPLIAQYWELDFRHDPTTLDHNADTQPDWQPASSQTFATANLDTTAGTWQAKQTLRTSPNHDFTQPTIIDLKMRHAATATSPREGALAILHADHNNGYAAPVGVLVQQQSTGQQTVILFTYHPNHDWDELARFPGYPADDFIPVRLIVSPDQASVNLHIDGIDRGSYAYRSVGATGLNRALNLTGHQTQHAQFQHVRVTVGGSP